MASGSPKDSGGTGYGEAGTDSKSSKKKRMEKASSKKKHKFVPKGQSRSHRDLGLVGSIGSGDYLGDEGDTGKYFK